MKTSIICIALMASAQILAAEDIFESRSCYESPISRNEAIELLGPGETHKTIGRFDVWERQRNCNPVTGCTAWRKPAVTSKPSDTYFAVHDTLSTKTGIVFSVHGSAVSIVCWNIGAADQTCHWGGTRVEGVVGRHCFWLQTVAGPSDKYQYSAAGTF